MWLNSLQDICICVILQLQSSLALLPTSPRVDMNFTELVEFDGYDSEVHHVTTNDGYVLTLFRVRKRGACTGAYNGTGEKEPILFAHGLYLSGDDCVIPGPHAAHCYLYVDACHDSWVYNARGSRYSRAHATLNPDTDPQYWNFTFDEMALYDLPASIDYILQQTGQKQIVYVGHSQSVAVLILLCVKIPDYNAKVKVGFGLSPLASMSYSRFAVVKVEKVLSPLLLWMDKTNTYFELFSYGGFSQRMARFFCALTQLSYPFCSALNSIVIGNNRFHITAEVLAVLFGHLPSGTSAKNFLRWGQIARNGFSEYDYGEEENLRRYGGRSPPLIDLSQVTMEWVLIASVNDYIADLKDVDVIMSQLPNARQCVLTDHSIGHLDFIFGTSVVKYIVPMILSFLDKSKFVCL